MDVLPSPEHPESLLRHIQGEYASSGPKCSVLCWGRGEGRARGALTAKIMGGAIRSTSRVWAASSSSAFRNRREAMGGWPTA